MLGDALGDGVFEGLEAFSGDGGDGEEGELAAGGHRFELFELGGVGGVDLGGDDEGGLGGEGGVEAAELVGDDAVVFDGVSRLDWGVGEFGYYGLDCVVACRYRGLSAAALCAFGRDDGVLGWRGGGADGGVGDVDEVDEDGGALDVAEELDAEAGAEVGAFDEAGHVGDGEAELVGGVADLDDAEVGLEGGEGVVGDLGAGGGEARDQRGFADVGEADEAGVGEEAELEAEGAFVAGAAELVLAGGLVGTGREVLIAAAAATSAGDDDLVVGGGEVVDELAGGVVVEDGADGDVEGDGLAAVAGHVGAEAVAAALALPLGVEAEMDEGVVREGRAHEDVAAVTAVAAGGTAAGDEFFTAKGHGAVAAIAGFDADAGFIDEHLASVAGGWWGGRRFAMAMRRAGVGRLAEKRLAKRRLADEAVGDEAVGAARWRWSGWWWGLVVGVT